MILHDTHMAGLRRVFASCLRIAALTVFIAAPGHAQAQGVAPPDRLSWARPAFPTKPAEDKVITTVDTYNYTVSSYTPAVQVAPIVRNAASFATPEAATVTQFSAMIARDVDWFSTTWTPASWAETEAYNAAIGRTPDEMSRLWQSVFAAARPIVIRRIDTGPYTIITYKYVAPDGKPLLDIEMPLILEKFEGRWLATQALRKDSFPVLSPWITGESEHEATVQ